MKARFNIYEIEHNGDVDAALMDLHAAGCKEVRVIATDFDDESAHEKFMSKTKTEEPTVQTGTTNGEREPESREETVELLPLDRCYISEQNTRTLPAPKAEDIQSLALSMEMVGQITPGIVRLTPEGYEICAGARRFVACRVAKMPHFKAVVRKLDDDEFEEALLVENLQREDPDPRAEVRLIERLTKRGVRTAEEISSHLGKPRHWAQRRLGLLRVIAEIRKMWESPAGYRFQNYTVEMMAFIGSLPESTQHELKEHNMVYSARNLAELSKLIDAQVLCRLDKAPFDLNDPKYFVKGCGPGCACDSAKEPALFDFESKAKGRCLQPSCFHSRIAKWQDETLKNLRKEHGDLPVVTTEYFYNGGVKVGTQQVKAQRVWAMPAEKPDKIHSLKVIVLEKTGAVRIGYLISGRGVGAKKGKLKPSAERLAERKKILQGKRWLLVHEELKKALIEAPLSKCVENVIDLVTVFGLPWKATTEYAYQRKENPHWQRFDERKRKGYSVPNIIADGEGARLEKSREAALWAGVKTVLLDVMKPTGNVGDAAGAEGDLRRVAKLIKFPIEERKILADLKVLPPKTWGTVDVHTLEPARVLSKEGKELASARAGKQAEMKLAKAKKGGAK